MKAALFDLDGVLIDTEGIYSEFWGAMGLRHGVGIDNFADVIKGTTLNQILNKYFPKEKHEEIIAELIDFEQHMQYRLFPGVKDMLDALKQAHIPMAIVTSSGEKKLSNIFTQIPGFKEYFDTIITDAQVTKSKPDPQGYQLAAATLGVAPADCVVFEDSYNGLIAGRRSGAHVVALATTNPRATLTDKADMVIDSFTDVTLKDLLNV